MPQWGKDLLMKCWIHPFAFIEIELTKGTQWSAMGDVDFTELGYQSLKPGEILPDSTTGRE